MKFVEWRGIPLPGENSLVLDDVMLDNGWLMMNDTFLPPMWDLLPSIPEIERFKLIL